MVSQHLRIPYGIIRQLCYPGGVRLEPRMNKARPSEPSVDASYHYITHKGYNPGSHSGIVVVNPTQVTPEHPKAVMSLAGNLSNEAYRFFKGSPIESSDYFRCRGCEQEEQHKARKITHMKDCRLLMQTIVEFLKRDKLCVICNTQTKRERWTVPLCSEACINKWRFTIPPAWLAAKQLVLAHDSSLLRKRDA